LTVDETSGPAQGLVGLVKDLLVREACDREAGELEVHVLSAVAFEGSARRMERIAVDLDHSPLLAP
jgi:hypothetical protein